ncbi:MAG: SPOR domain-containing protein [Betaproteobacteria bacterium]
MARDPKYLTPAAEGRAPARGGGKKRGLNPMFIGIIIGLLLGLGMALGFALWLHRENNPFIEKTQPVSALPTIPAKTLQPSASAQSQVVQPAVKGDPGKPRFEFYQILPGEKNDKSVRSEHAPTPAPIPAPKVADAPKPEAGPKAPVESRTPEPRPAAETRAALDAKNPPKPEAKIDIKPASTEVFYLQAGAFQSATDADNMKAKVAFAGFEAMVRPVNLPDKGTLFRVRLGPYRSQDEVNRIKATLSQGGIGVVVVRGSD